MSCNYFLLTKDTDLAFDMCPRVSMLKETREFEIHLCQTTEDKKPLFESHGYDSFEKLKAILRNPKHNFILKDEYENVIEINDFIKTMEWLTKNGTKRINPMIKTDPDGFDFLDCDFV